MESAFWNDIVEKICPLKTFRTNYHGDFKNDIYSSRFYNTNSHDRAEWKCHTACWIFGKIRKLKIDNIYWNKLFQSFESLNWTSTGIKEELHQIKTLHSGKKLWQYQCDSSENLLGINTNFQSRGSKVPLWKLIL